MLNDKELLNDLYYRLVEDYNGNKTFEQHEEDRLALRHTLDTLDYRDFCITIFNDNEKYTLVFLNDLGQTKAICYDDNFFYAESLLDTYCELLQASYKSWKGENLNEKDKEEMKECLVAYCEHLKKQCEDFDLSCCDERVRGLLGVCE